MPPMPKHHTKGTFLEHLEDEIASSRGRAIAILRELRNPAQSIATMAVYTGAAKNAGEPADAAKRAAARTLHMERDWFGTVGYGPGPGPVPKLPDGQPAPGPNLPGRTGWWRNWHGRPEPVLKCGLIRALEVSMGLAHDCPEHPAAAAAAAAAAPENPNRRPRRLPVGFHWVCGVSRFEVFVSWNSRLVSAVIATPGFPFALRQFNSDAAAALDTFARKERGTIYVGQDEDPAYPFPEVAGMKLPIKTHRLERARGGSGTWP